jgi:hypothetical protein
VSLEGLSKGWIDGVFLVEEGAVFEGTRDQFADCFFSDPTEEGILDWAKNNGWSVESKINE